MSKRERGGESGVHRAQTPQREREEERAVSGVHTPQRERERGGEGGDVTCWILFLKRPDSTFIRLTFG